MRFSVIGQDAAPQSQPPGTLFVQKGSPNPFGASDAEMFLFSGDAVSAPITRIVPLGNAQLPECQLPLAHALRIKLLHFNDLHGRISCFTQEGTIPIFSRVAAWLNAKRSRYAGDEYTHVLAATCGDEIGGAIFDELLGDCVANFQLHPAYQLYSRAGVDVGIFGNHDFDLGCELLAHAIEQDLRFPILAANLIDSQALAAHFYTAALFVVKGVRVGFIGLTTPAQTHPDPDEPQIITDPMLTIRHLLPAIRPLCDVLVVLSHLGHRLGEQTASVAIAGDVELARSLPPDSVHLIVGAHTHNVLNEKGLSAENIVNDIPIVQAGKLGQFVGEVDITVQKVAAVTHVRLTTVADLPVDPIFERDFVQPLVQRVQPEWERVLGRVAADPDLSTDAVRNEFAAGESAMANFISDGLASEARRLGFPVDFAFIDTSIVRMGLDAGGIVRYGEWFDVMPFVDTLTLFELTGRQLDELLQDNAIRFDRIGQPHTERGFLHFSREIRYTITRDARRSQMRAIAITVDGASIADLHQRTFLAASSSFVRGPAAPWETYARTQKSHPLIDIRQLPHTFTHHYTRDLLVKHIIAHDGVTEAGGARRDGRMKVLGTGD
ncbi:MAG: bifunctional metallophosphatase/5'-nucleotidase [Caldilineales bacterium]|nr:bifunctional metallophosphatase/5'-nucleotidase [Caldilineales bacterium]